MKKVIMASALSILAAFSTEAAEYPERPHWSLEIKGGVLFPDIPKWSSYYGSSYTGEYGGSISYKILRQLEVGVEGSYTRKTGRGQLLQHQQSGNTTPAGEVTFQRAPLSLFVMGRGVFREDQVLVPYLGGGYTRVLYRSEVKGRGSRDGAADGFHGRGGLQFLLDRLEPEAAANVQHDFGLHHTYLFVEGRYIRAMADTTSGGSVNLGGTSCLGGILFEF